jgi:hypothetical protein
MLDELKEIASSGRFAVFKARRTEARRRRLSYLFDYFHGNTSKCCTIRGEDQVDGDGCPQCNAEVNERPG